MSLERGYARAYSGPWNCNIFETLGCAMDLATRVQGQLRPWPDSETGREFRFAKGAHEPVTFDLVALSTDGARHRVTFDLPPAAARVVVFDPTDATATVDGSTATVAEALASQQSIIGTPEFVTPNVDGEFPTMEQQDYLEGVIVAGEFE